HRVEAEDGAEQLGATSTDQARDAKHLPAPELERRFDGQPLTAEPIDGQHDVARGAVGPREALLDATARHFRNELVVRDRIEPTRRYRASVTQKRERLGDRTDLLEVVGDVEDGKAILSERMKQRKESVDLGRGEPARRLVEQEHPTARTRDGASNLDQLL